MVVVSVTELGTYRRCRQMWDFSSKHRRNLTGIGSGPEPLELGGLIHRALADWIVCEDSTKVQLEVVFLKHAAARQNEIKESYKARTGEDINPVDLESLQNVVKLGMHMMQNYQAHHKTPLPKHIRHAIPEQEVLVPVPGTGYFCKKCIELRNTIKDLVELDTKLKSVLVKKGTIRYIVDDIIILVNPDCEDCKGTGICYHYLSATLDGIVQDDKDRFLVLEHKTYENRPKIVDLRMNDQFTGYDWVVSQLGIGQCVGVAYDGMWKRAAPPKYMQKEKRPGTMDDLFIRKVLYKEPEEIAVWGHNVAKILNEIGNGPEIYPNVPWQGCGDCSFIEPCYAMMKGENIDSMLDRRYTQRTEIVRGGQVETK